MSIPSSGAPQGSSVSDLVSLEKAFTEAHWGHELLTLRSFVSKMVNEDASTCSAGEAQRVFSEAAASVEMQHQSRNDFLSLYAPNPEGWREDLLDDVAALSIYDPDKYIPPENKHDALKGLKTLGGQELLEEARRLAELSRIELRRMLEDAAATINKKLGLEGANAIQVPEVRDSEGHQTGDKAKEAGGMVEGKGE